MYHSHQCQLCSSMFALILFTVLGVQFMASDKP